MNIQNNIKIEMQEKGCSCIDDLMSRYNTFAYTASNENLLTIYLNAKIGFSKAVDFIEAGYSFQPSLIIPENLSAFYEDFFLSKDSFNRSYIKKYKEKMFDKPHQLSYWALTLPIKRRFELFELFYESSDEFKGEDFNIIEDIFSQGAMTFNSIEDWKNFNRKLKYCLKFLIEQNKINLNDIDKLTQEDKVEKLYFNQVFQYYNFILSGDKIEVSTNSTSQSMTEKTIEEKSPSEELEKLKIKLSKYYLDHKLEEKQSVISPVQKI